MNAAEIRSWRVAVSRSDVYVLRGVEARTEEEVVERARELLSQHDVESSAAAKLR
jgi:hypothetical protein